LKKFLKTKLNTNHLIFKSLRNKVTQQIRKASANFFFSAINEAKETLKNYRRALTNYLKRKVSGNTLQYGWTNMH